LLHLRGFSWRSSDSRLHASHHDCEQKSTKRLHSGMSRKTVGTGEFERDTNGT
jgi:hypothetical protein